MTKLILMACALLTVAGVACAVALKSNQASNSSSEERMSDETKSKNYDLPLEERLTPIQFKVTQEHGTERAFTGVYWDNKEDGIYHCVCCGDPLFDSSTKYESGTGWPSFYDVLNSENVKLTTDKTLFWQTRTEVSCQSCGAHLGHVFNDGPEPTGKRYCLNSAALDFEKREK